MAHAFTHHERPQRLECHGSSRWRSGSRDVLALDAFLVGEISGASDAGHPADLRAKIAARTESSGCHHIAFPNMLSAVQTPMETLRRETPLSEGPTKVRRIQAR